MNIHLRKFSKYNLFHRHFIVAKEKQYGSHGNKVLYIVLSVTCHQKRHPFAMDALFC